MTDAVIQFNYSDNIYLVSFYRKANSFPNEIGKSLITFLNAIDEDDGRKGRLNWENVVMRLLADFVEEVDRNDGIKIIREVEKDDKSFIYRWIITPVNDLYMNEKLPYIKAINVDLMYQIGQKKIFNGLLSDLEKIKLEE